MGLTYKQFYSELQGNFPRSPVDLCMRWVNRAVRDIYDSRLWSFLQDEGVLYSPAQITTGTVEVTQFSATITFNAAARAALQVSNPVVTKRQFRVNGGPLYTFASTVNAGTGVATLDRLYREATNSSANYSVYRAIYGPPENGAGTETTDFARYNNIYTPSLNRYFSNVDQPISWLDNRDPQRAVSGNPYKLFPLKASSSGIQQYEMWPHPLSEFVHIANYQRKGVELSADSDTLPAIIPDSLVIERASFYGCDWAMKNQSKFPELKGVNWLNQKLAHKRTYSNIDQKEPGLLEIAHRNDEELNPQSILLDRRSFSNYPLGDDDLNSYYNINAG